MKNRSNNGSFRSKLTMLSLFAGTVLQASMSQAYSNFPGAVDSAVKSLYGTSASYSYSCNGCHTSGFTVSTVWGQDFKNNAVTLGYSVSSMSNTQVTAVIKAYATKDSDSDGANNQAEYLAGTNPADSTSKPAPTPAPTPTPTPIPTPTPTPVPVCARMNPSLTFSTVSLSSYAGATLNYQLTLVNNDSSACASSTFSIEQALPVGLTGNLSTQSIVLAPGANQKFSLSLSSSSNLAAGLYYFSIKATNSAATAYSKTATGNLLINPPLPVCTRVAPEVVLNPAAQNANPGDLRTFQLSVKNLDSVECSPTTFAISLPAVSGLTLTSTASSLTLSPGQSNTVSIDARVATSIAQSIALKFAANVSSAASTLHKASASGTLNVTVLMQTQDTVAPTQVDILDVSKRGPRTIIVFSPSTDASNSITYQVRVDGVSVGETTLTTIKLRLPAGGQSLVIRAIDPSGNFSDSAAMSISQLTQGRK